MYSKHFVVATGLLITKSMRIILHAFIHTTTWTHLHKHLSFKPYHCIIQTVSIMCLEDKTFVLAPYEVSQGITSPNTENNRCLLSSWTVEVLQTSLQQHIIQMNVSLSDICRASCRGDEPAHLFESMCWNLKTVSVI